MQCSLPKSEFDDVSNFRQVPDNQEVFTNVSTGTCIVIELMSKQEVSNEQCGVFFFSDLATSNSSVDTVVTVPQCELASSSIPNIPFAQSPGCSFACIVGGTQKVSKFTNEVGRENLVFVGMGVLRFPSPIATDILVSVTAPQQLDQGSTDATVVSRVVEPPAVGELLNRILSSLQVNDWGLFVPE